MAQNRTAEAAYDPRHCHRKKAAAIFAAILSLMIAAAQEYPGADPEGPHYWKTARSNPLGVAVVAHGLNVKPSKMGSPELDGTLVKLLLDSGFNVLRVTLRGHSGPIEEMRTVTQEQWLSDAYTQYSQARYEADKDGLPIYLVGFSLGALVFEDLLNQETETLVEFKKAILFSPALAIKSSARALLLLRPFAGSGSIIHSVSPRQYRAQRGASLAAYSSIFLLEKHLQNLSFANCNIPTIVFMDKQDEFISLKALLERIDEYGLSNWKVIEVSNKGAVINPPYHHLIIDKDCVSSKTWEAICAMIVNFLES